jgi:hypothetical protein
VADPAIWQGLAALLVLGGVPLALGTIFIPSLRSALARRIGGRAAEDEAALIALQLHVEALQRQVDALTQALERSGSVGFLPPAPQPPDRSLRR